jgi:hypothetical protein
MSASHKQASQLCQSTASRKDLFAVIEMVVMAVTLMIELENDETRQCIRRKCVRLQSEKELPVAMI